MTLSLDCGLPSADAILLVAADGFAGLGLSSAFFLGGSSSTLSSSSSSSLKYGGTSVARHNSLNL